VARSGATIVIAGKPNAGKSSIFNRLVGSERAIVTEEPGTTRDLIGERSELRGVPVQLYDTAGIRQPTNSIESIGIEKCADAMRGADILLLVIDASAPWDPSDRELLREANSRNSLIALNKSDLPPRKLAGEIRESLPEGRIIEVSALTGRGMEELSEAIFQVLAGPVESAATDQALVFRHRHENCVHAAFLALEQCREAVASSLSEEYLLYHLHQALEQLDRMTGAATTDDLLDTIFSTFCIGK
jgi:tRNA modification GTPase